MAKVNKKPELKEEEAAPKKPGKKKPARKKPDIRRTKLRKKKTAKKKPAANTGPANCREECPWHGDSRRCPWSSRGKLDACPWGKKLDKSIAAGKKRAERERTKAAVRLKLTKTTR